MVDLPAPVSPTNANVSPAGITRSMSRSTGRPGTYSNADVLEPHLARQLGQVGRARAVDDRRHLAEQVADLADRRLALLVRVVELHELLDRREERGEVEEERHQLADLHRAVEHPAPADHEDHHLAGHADGLGEAAVGGADGGGGVVGPPVAPARSCGARRRCAAGGCAPSRCARPRGSPGGAPSRRRSGRARGRRRCRTPSGTRASPPSMSGTITSRVMAASAGCMAISTDGDEHHREALHEQLDQPLLEQLREVVEVARHPGHQPTRPSRGRRSRSRAAGSG